MKNLYEYLIENYSNSVPKAVEYVRNLYPNYPVHPVKPRLLTIKSTPAEHRQYADDLEQYNELMVTYHQEKDEYQTKVNEINLELEKFIKEIGSLNRIPEQYRNKVWSLAWEKGHANRSLSRTSRPR